MATNHARPHRETPRTTGEVVLFQDGLALECGRTLGPITVAYEQYGKPNADRSNVVLVCHALSGGAHAAGLDPDTGRRGWWDTLIGPGKGIDTDRWCVLSSNVLGSCYGTTGPSSVDPATGRPYGSSFPVVTVWDMVRVQAALLDALGIDSLAAVVGGSMGGMQALAWPVLFPGRVRSVVAIATTDRHSAQQIALNEVARRAVTSDPAWKGGRYEPGEGPSAGLSVARMLGHVTYLSDEGMTSKFGRRLRHGRPGYDLDVDFEVEHYLRHQGRKFVDRFDANTLLYVTRALDYFDMSERHGSLADAVAASDARFLLVAFSSDWLYPAHAMARLAEALDAANKDVSYHCIESAHGHDSFLLENPAQASLVSQFLEEGALRCSGETSDADYFTVSTPFIPTAKWPGNEQM